MKTSIIFLIFFFIPIFPASAASSSPLGEAGTAHITEVYSDLESFDVTLYAGKPYDHLSLEVTLLKPVGNNEEVIAKQNIPVDILPANSRITKVGYWNIKNADRGAYSIRANLIGNGRVILESKYDFTYGAGSALKLRFGNLIANSEGITIVLSPVEPVLFDIKYMLVDGNDVIYTTGKDNVSLTSAPESFSAIWGTLLENNKEYQGRVKVKINSSEEETLVSTKPFTARDNAEITDIYKDETGASATVYGRSQVPFEGSLVFNVYPMKQDIVNSNSEPMESILEKVPVLLEGDDETVEVAWNQRLEKGLYKLEIELLGNNGEVIEQRETVIESNLSPYSNANATNNSSSTTNASDGKRSPGFSAAVLISGLAAISYILRKQI
jgi:hypothetical protein